MNMKDKKVFMKILTLVIKCVMALYLTELISEHLKKLIFSQRSLWLPH